MPFENLTPRLGTIPIQPVPHFNIPPVMPIGDIIQHGAQQVENLLDTFNPLSRAERQAKIQLATMQTYAIQQAQHGNWQPFMALHGHFQDIQAQNLQHAILLNKLKSSNLSYNKLLQDQNDLHEAFSGGPKGTNNTFHKADEKTANDAIGVDTVPYAPLSNQLSAPVPANQPLGLGERAPLYQYPETSPEDYWSTMGPQAV